MLRASVHLDPRWNRGPVDPRIYGGFLEHLGRAVHEGVYDPGSPRSDARGFRTDVIDALRALKMPVMRYPGGNYVSAHHWKDGIGPKDSRPRRPDFAWKSIEPNTFGTDEFIEWCREVGTAPMLAVNLGTAGGREAAEYVEYTNRPRGTSWADRRPSDEPYGVKLWCLGNEMDGPWQAGHVPAGEYAMRAEQAGKLMKGLDSTIETVVAGSSARGMSTYLKWDREVLEYCWDSADYISLHRYSENHRNDTAWFLAEGIEIERIIADYRGLVEYVRGVKKSEKRVGLSFDEWNVWYKALAGDGGWQEAPHLLEEVYNLEDALVCAQYLMAFLRNADVLKIGCLAQIVNVIAPMLTTKDGLLIQSIYHTIRMIAETGHGTALTPVVEAPLY
ncbi:alpha-N-arabinofuranosidase, partial [bacterium]